MGVLSVYLFGFIMCMSALPTHVYIHNTCSAHRGQVSDPLEPELLMVVSHHVDAEN